MLLRRYFVIAICGVLIASGAVSGQEVMKAVGDEVSFKLDTIVPPFTSITWKHIKDAVTVKAIEWEDGEATSTPNPRFKDITTLDVKTGQITITKLTLEHSGVYTIDISGKEQTQRFTLTVMKPVPKPEIKIEQSSSPGVVYLRCEYDDKIIWKNSTGEILAGAKITKGESLTVKKNGNPENFYTCTLENAASRKTSERVYETDLFKDESSGGSSAVIIVICIILVLLLNSIICAVFWYKRNEKFQKFVVATFPCIKGPETEDKGGNGRNMLNEASGVETNRPASQDPQATDSFLGVNMQNEVSGVETNRPASQDPQATDRLFKTFVEAQECKETLNSFKELCKHLEVEPRDYKNFYSNLKVKLNNPKAKELWQKIDKRAANKQSLSLSVSLSQCLVVGAGPCGLKTAIELALLGFQVVVLEKRDSFSRKNLVHLWTLTVDDLTALGVKTIYSKFCSGSIAHISICQLQLILLKLALILGVEVHTGVEFEGLCKPSETSFNGPDMELKGWRANVKTADRLHREKRLADYQFDVLISTGGTKFMPADFTKEIVREELAIGIIVIFVNRRTLEEMQVPETGGITRKGIPGFFEKLEQDKGIKLENIVYYKDDDTHYFVMTAEKQSLITKQVIKTDLPDVKNLLKPENIDKISLETYALEAADFYTQCMLPVEKTGCAVSIFDFTCLHKADKASLVKEERGKKLLIGLVGDSLIEPYWPLGTGIGIGFLSVFDTVCMVSDWRKGVPDQQVIEERERVYKLLCEMKENNTTKSCNAYYFDLSKRCPNLNLPEPVPKPEITVKTDNSGVVNLICKYNETIIWRDSAGETLMGSAICPKGESITVKKKGNPEIFYTCTLQNAVSEKTSDPVYERDLFKGSCAADMGDGRNHE